MGVNPAAAGLLGGMGGGIVQAYATMGEFACFPKILSWCPLWVHHPLMIRTCVRQCWPVIFFTMLLVSQSNPCLLSITYPVI
jgi:hypothetical protein